MQDELINENNIEKFRELWKRSSERERQKIIQLISETHLSPDQLHEQACEVLEHLNLRSGRKFRKSRRSLTHIVERLREGVTIEDCLHVIDNRCRVWKTDSRMSDHLNPVTLFRPEKFEKYIGMARADMAALKNNPTRKDTTAPPPHVPTTKGLNAIHALRQKFQREQVDVSGKALSDLSPAQRKIYDEAHAKAKAMGLDDEKAHQTAIVRAAR